VSLDSLQYIELCAYFSRIVQLHGLAFRGWLFIRVNYQALLSNSNLSQTVTEADWAPSPCFINADWLYFWPSRIDEDWFSGIVSLMQNTVDSRALSLIRIASQALSLIRIDSQALSLIRIDSQGIAVIAVWIDSQVLS